MLGRGKTTGHEICKCVALTFHWAPYLKDFFMASVPSHLKSNHKQ